MGYFPSGYWFGRKLVGKKHAPLPAGSPLCTITFRVSHGNAAIVGRCKFQTFDRARDFAFSSKFHSKQITETPPPSRRRTAFVQRPWWIDRPDEIYYFGDGRTTPLTVRIKPSGERFKSVRRKSSRPHTEQVYIRKLEMSRTRLGNEIRIDRVDRANNGRSNQCVFEQPIRVKRQGGAIAKFQKRKNSRRFENES